MGSSSVFSFPYGFSTVLTSTNEGDWLGAFSAFSASMISDRESDGGWKREKEGVV